MFIFRGRGTGISTAPAGAPLVSSLACLGESSPCWLGVWASDSCGLGAGSSNVGCFCVDSVDTDAAGFEAWSWSWGLGGRSFSWGLGGRSESWGLGGNSDNCGFGGRSDNCGLGGRSKTWGLGGISPGWGLSAGCGILGGGSVGLVIVSAALVGVSEALAGVSVGLCSTSGPWLGLSTEETLTGVFRNATERQESDHGHCCFETYKVKNDLQLAIINQTVLLSLLLMPSFKVQSVWQRTSSFIVLQNTSLHYFM